MITRHSCHLILHIQRILIISDFKSFTNISYHDQMTLIYFTCYFLNNYYSYCLLFKLLLLFLLLLYFFVPIVYLIQFEIFISWNSVIIAYIESSSYFIVSLFWITLLFLSFRKQDITQCKVLIFFTPMPILTGDLHLSLYQSILKCSWALVFHLICG